MELKVYNSLTKKLEKFETLVPGQVKMYCCGPTVYDLVHVGNFRGAIFYNFVRNWLEQMGYKVTFVYNYTDVDDKIINRAKAESVDSLVISEKFIAEFKKDFLSLGLRPHDFNPKVTETIGPIIKMVEELVKSEKAYVVDGEVLYSIKSFPEYGKLSGRNPDELEAGARVEVDQKKRNPHDFALWKPSKPEEPSWDSPWGKGRPGWHIECSAMVRSILGDTIDIHGGGSDLIFPHHENEVAQSEGCTGHPLARYWIHNNMFTFGGQKMSKSVGNIWRARDFINEYHGEIFKYMVLNVHYRSLAEFTEQTADLAIKALARIYSALSMAEVYVQESTVTAVEDKNFKAQLDKLWTDVEAAFCMDFGTPEAFAKLFEVVRLYNSSVKRGIKTNGSIKYKSLLFVEWIKRFGNLMSLFQENPSQFLTFLDDRLLQKMGIDRAEIDQLVNKRTAARQNKDFAESDCLRKMLTEKGIQVADLPEGSFWEVIK